MRKRKLSKSKIITIYTLLAIAGLEIIGVLIILTKIAFRL